MATRIQETVDELLKQGDELRADYDALIAERSSNRTLLRNFAKSGAATAAQVKKINEMYPERTKKGATAANGGGQ